MVFCLKNDVIGDFIEILTFSPAYVTFDGAFSKIFDAYPQKGVPLPSAYA